MAYSAKVAGSNCIGPSAPAPLAPLDTPGRLDRPLSLSTRPIAASTLHDNPGHRAAAAWSSSTHEAGTAGPPVPDPGSGSTPAPPGDPRAPTTTLTQPPRATDATTMPAATTPSRRPTL